MATNLLTVPLRHADPVPLASALRAYIEHSYDQHPDMFRLDITELQRLRDAAVAAEVRPSSISMLTRYFVQLTFITAKFPADINLVFTWHLCLGYAKAAFGHADLQYERANLLFNLAAMYSLLASEENRATVDGLKRAAQYLQAAAGCFAHLKTAVVPEMKLNPPEELAPATLDVLTSLMLAQAQECFWQKAVLDSLKNSIIARLASQVSTFYAAALTSTTRCNSLRTEWINHITFKKLHFTAAMQYRAAADCLANRKYGEEIARLTAGLDACAKALSSAKGVAKPVIEDLKGLQTKLKSDLTRAERDNNLIYLEDVPAESALSAIKPAVTVSAATPNDVSDAMAALQTDKYGEPLFAKLVPFAAHQAASIYDDRRDTLVTQLVIRKLDTLTVQLHDVLARLGLPGALQAIEQPVSLPPTLLAHAEEIRARGGFDAMRESVEDVRSLYYVASSICSNIAEALQAEQRDDDSLRQRYGTASWRRAPSTEAAAKLHSQATAFANTLAQAAASDEHVRAKFREHEAIFRLLSSSVPGELENALPAASVRKLEPGLETANAVLRERLNDISRFEYRRRKYIEDLRERAQKDEVAGLILAETTRLEHAVPLATIDPSQFEKLFTTRLAQLYDADKERVDAEHDEQADLLTELELANNDFRAALAHSNASDGAVSDRERALQQLEAGYVTYNELVANLDEGRTFYNDLTEIMAKCQDEVNDFVYSRNMEAHELQTELNAQFSRFAAPNPHGNQAPPPVPPLPPQVAHTSSTPLPAPRAQGLPPRMLTSESNSGVWNPSMGIQFGRQ
ncbi:BRO1-like domain-containing protein [Limtongia smithiae]|uniref:BRO1-like domain-containing protein n=1 Tax=Limtongia smithiae TaxID=1125753 RepID=UPI0034CDC7E7